MSSDQSCSTVKQLEAKLKMATHCSCSNYDGRGRTTCGFVCKQHADVLVNRLMEENKRLKWALTAFGVGK